MRDNSFFHFPNCTLPSYAYLAFMIVAYATCVPCCVALVRSWPKTKGPLRQLYQCALLGVALIAVGMTAVYLQDGIFEVANACNAMHVINVVYAFSLSARMIAFPLLAGVPRAQQRLVQGGLGWSFLLIGCLGTVVPFVMVAYSSLDYADAYNEAACALWLLIGARAFRARD